MPQISGKGRGLLSNSNSMSPAELSVPVGSLFPPCAVAAELRGPGDAALLLPEEAAFLGRAVPKRVHEFAAGRLCARRALAEFGIAGFALCVAADRQPVWPESMVGSITHTAGFCAAVVAERERVLSLGLDSEVVGRVNQEIWPSICGAREIAWIGSLPPGMQAAAVTLIFSAKEAFYKCQYPLTGERLGFHDVWIEAAPGWTLGGTFLVHAFRSIAVAKRTLLPMPGRHQYHEEFVTAGVSLAAAPSQ
jgi:4'-phosphopantetheinyl transferase EntD